MSIATYHKKTIRDIDVRGKRVLVRVDFNVPRDDAGNPTDLTRVNRTLHAQLSAEARRACGVDEPLGPA